MKIILKKSEVEEIIRKHLNLQSIPGNFEVEIEGLYVAPLKQDYSSIPENNFPTAPAGTTTTDYPKTSTI